MQQLNNTTSPKNTNFLTAIVGGRLKPAYIAGAAGDNSNQPPLVSRRSVAPSTAHSSDSSAGCALPGGGDGAEVAPGREGLYKSMAFLSHQCGGLPKRTRVAVVEGGSMHKTEGRSILFYRDG